LRCPSTFVRIAGSAETSFNALLHADSDCNLPDSDADVISALSSYGANFKKGKSAAHAEARLDLLSGLLWLQTTSFIDNSIEAGILLGGNGVFTP
jgi:hypothetical protein